MTATKSRDTGVLCPECNSVFVPWDRQDEPCKGCRELTVRSATGPKCKDCGWPRRSSFGDYCSQCVVDRAFKESAKPKKRGWLWPLF